jgi:hypothetical protein
MDTTLVVRSLAVYGEPVKPPLAKQNIYVDFVGKKSTRRAVPRAKERDVLAMHVKNLMNGSEFNSQPTLAKKTEMGSGTIGRILRAEAAVTLDTLAAIAKVFDLQPWQLIHPSMGKTDEALMAYEQARAAFNAMAFIPNIGSSKRKGKRGS